MVAEKNIGLKSPTNNFQNDQSSDNKLSFSLMELLLGIDVGTSGCKVSAIDTDGNVIASGSQSYTTSHPRPGWSEQNPEDWYQAACLAIRACLDSGKLETGAIIGVSVDGPAHNVALLDDDSHVLYPTIHWSDLRSVTQSKKLESTCNQRIFDITGQPVNPSWTLTQLLWLRENESEVWSRLRRILVTKDYVRHRFTGDYVTDVYDAIGTQLYDVSNNCWSEELCDLLEYRRSWLPAVMSAFDIAGNLLPKAAGDTGLPQGIPVAVGSGDSVVEAFGSGVVHPGQCIIKLGTAGNVNLVTARSHPSSKVLTYRHIIADHWFTIAATNSGAATMRWFRDAFCSHLEEEARSNGISVYELIGQLAGGVPAGSEGLLFHPYLKGERSPHWDPYLRGDFVGISARHRLDHFARSVLEGVAFSLRDCFEDVAKMGQPITDCRFLGGGARSPLWRQIVCDIFGRPLLLPKITDASFGAALLAGVAVQVFADWRSALSKCVRIEETLNPNREVQELYNDYFDIYRAISRDMANYSHRLVDLVDS
jgi:xylulokinase